MEIRGERREEIFFMLFFFWIFWIKSSMEDSGIQGLFGDETRKYYGKCCGKVLKTVIKT